MQPSISAEPKMLTWDQRFQQLAEFHAAHGHCRVSRHVGDHKPLGEWLKSQRKYHRDRKLTTEQEAKLNSLGFEWAPAAPTLVWSGVPGIDDPAYAIWEERFVELVAFAAEFGHTRVPKEWPPNTKLASWVSSQRTYQRKGLLKPEHRQRLEDIGFIWDARPTPAAKHAPPAKLDAWDLQFAELANFKAHHGTTQVPRHYKDDTKLLDWVNEQRRQKAKGQLSEEKIYWLNELGFKWE